ncbi:glycosyltransferase [Zongyangia hominis]|uniref:Glycosyltransferase n=1 Tax=Zongyangia hominis TaxID=2763677 RepID=A0A926IAN8_9FIRM|nr:glycosyltransferase [Zongyangia hominis]MBC8570406.1 glycosyltransferase [Zongyangia hominis]
MTILYITFIDFGELKSGSSVRPQKMFHAFESLGHEVKLLEGQQNRRAERRQRVEEILSWLDTHKPDICYVEPPAGPFFNRIDLKLLRRVHRMGVPIALFYRDAYWKFAKWWGVTGPKKWVLIHMHKRDLRAFGKDCDILYFPSPSMADLFTFPRREPLPPGGDVHCAPHTELFHRIVYVGGISEKYGSIPLLEAVERLQEKGLDIKLTLVCREAEREHLDERYLKMDWLDVRHASGDEELAPLYAQADAGILPMKRDFYMDFAVHVKMFEYMGYGLPLIATDCVETKRIIDRYGCGFTCKDDAASLADAIERFYSSPEQIDVYRRNVVKAMEENRWENRAQKVVEDLSALC